MHRFFAAALLCLSLGATLSPSPYDGSDAIRSYQHFVGVSSAAEIPTLTFTLPGDIYFDHVQYTIGSTSSLETFAKSAFGIAKSIYHDQRSAVQVDENTAVAEDDGSHLKDLVTLEALITGRIAFESATAVSPQRVEVRVPGGWPVDLALEPNGRLFRATIHGTQDRNFAPLEYSKVGGANVATNWLIDTDDTRTTSVRVSTKPIVPPALTGPSWVWLPGGVTWSTSFEPDYGRPVIPISVNGVAATCILDSGSAGFVLSDGLAAKAGVHGLGLALMLRRVGHGAAEYGRADVVVGPAELRSSVVVTAPWIADGTAICGYDFLASFFVELDKHVMTISAHQPQAPTCSLDCIRVDTWDRTAATTNLRMDGFQIGRATIDTGAYDPFIVDSLLQSVSGAQGAPASCGTHRYQQRRVTIDSLDLGSIPTCYATFTNSSYQAIVGVGLLNRYYMVFDLGCRMIWLRPLGASRR